MRALHIRILVLGSCLVAVAALAGAAAQRAIGRHDFVTVTPDEVQWRDIPDGQGAQVATLLGDPDKPGLYVVRVKFPPHLMDLPHRHPNARYVTVLQGTWYAGTGDTFEPARAVPLKPGSLMMHPARASHWDGSASDDTVIVQIIGYGPSQSVPVDPAQPGWVHVSR